VYFGPLVVIGLRCGKQACAQQQLQFHEIPPITGTMMHPHDRAVLIRLTEIKTAYKPDRFYYDRPTNKFTFR